MANTFDLATGMVTFKGNFDTFEKDIAKAEEKVEGLNKALGDGSFRMAASAAAGINKEMEKAQKAAKRMMDEIRLGKMGVLLRDAATGMSKFVASMRMMAVGGMAAGGSALGLASVASPVAADTLQKSMKLLAATIGKDFIPLIAEVSFAIQDAAAAWERLDPAIKSNVAEITKMVAMAGAASVALLGLGRALSFIKSHPIMAAIGVGVAAGTYLKNKDEAANARLDKRNAEGQRLVSGISTEDTNDAQMQQLRNMERSKGLAEAQRQWKEAKDKYNELAVKYNNYDRHAELMKPGMGQEAKGGREALLTETLQAQAEFRKREIRWADLAKDPKTNLASRASVGGMNAILDGIAGGASSGVAGKHNIAGSGPSSYTSLQEFYRSFNVAATSGDVFDQKMLDIAQKSLQQFQEMNQKIGALVPAQ